MVNLVDTFFEQSCRDEETSFFSHRLERPWLEKGSTMTFWTIEAYFGDRNAELVNRANEAHQIVTWFGRKVNFVLNEPRVQASVLPDQLWNTITFNLFTLLNPEADLLKIVHHEDGHLSQKEATWNAYEIPGHNRISEGSNRVIEKKLGVKIEARALVEWAIEWRTKRALWKDENCAYHEFEVPLFEKFARLIQHYTGKNILPLFDRLTPWSTREMEEAIALWANLMLLEEAALNMWWIVQKPQKVILFSVGKALVSEGTDLGSIEEAQATIRRIRPEEHQEYAKAA